MLAGATAVAAGFLPPALFTATPAAAELAWQLKQPRDWQIFSQTPQPPPGDMRPAALVVAGRPDAGGELVVLRVPLDTNPKSPNAAAAKNLVDYFSTPVGQATKVPMKDAVEAVASSQRTSPQLTKFALVGLMEEQVQKGKRYVRYEYDSLVCPGIIRRGTQSDSCEVPDTGEQVDQFGRRHAIRFTVVKEDNPTGPPQDVLWLVDISAPSEAWPYAQVPIGELISSFEVGSAEDLEKDREAYRQELNAELAKANATLPVPAP